jgi:hypothetical protein
LGWWLINGWNFGMGYLILRKSHIFVNDNNEAEVDKFSWARVLAWS